MVQHIAVSKGWHFLRGFVSPIFSYCILDFIIVSNDHHQGWHEILHIRSADRFKHFFGRPHTPGWSFVQKRLLRLQTHRYSHWVYLRWIGLAWAKPFHSEFYCILNSKAQTRTCCTNRLPNALVTKIDYTTTKREDCDEISLYCHWWFVLLDTFQRVCVKEWAKTIYQTPLGD